jgi:hypothetical protein
MIIPLKFSLNNFDQSFPQRSMNEIIVFGRKVGSDFLMAFMFYFHGIISDLAMSYMADKEVVMYWFYCTHFLS